MIRRTTIGLGAAFTRLKRLSLPGGDMCAVALNFCRIAGKRSTHEVHMSFYAKVKVKMPNYRADGFVSENDATLG